MENICNYFKKEDEKRQISENQKSILTLIERYNNNDISTPTQKELASKCNPIIDQASISRNTPLLVENGLLIKDAKKNYHVTAKYRKTCEHSEIYKLFTDNRDFISFDVIPKSLFIRTPKGKAQTLSMLLKKTYPEFNLTTFYNEEGVLVMTAEKWDDFEKDIMLFFNL